MKGAEGRKSPQTTLHAWSLWKRRRGEEESQTTGKFQERFGQTNGESLDQSYPLAESHILLGGAHCAQAWPESSPQEPLL